MRNILKNQPWLVICLGVIIGLFVLTTSTAPSDIQNESADNQETISAELNYEAVPSAVQANVERNSYLIETLLDYELQETTKVESNRFLPYPAKVFEIVFEHIISPNSP